VRQPAEQRGRVAALYARAARSARRDHRNNEASVRPRPRSDSERAPPTKGERGAQVKGSPTANAGWLATGRWGTGAGADRQGPRKGIYPFHVWVD